MRTSFTRGLSFLAVSGVFATLAACGPSASDAPAPASSADAPSAPAGPQDCDGTPTAATLGLDVSDAYGPPDVALPASAKVVDHGLAASLVASAPFRWVGPKLRTNDQAAAAADAMRDDATIATFLATHTVDPDLVKRFDATPDPSDATIRALPGGNYALTLPGGAVVETLGLAAKHHTVARAMREYPKRSNKEGIYAELYAHLPAANQASLPAPGNLGGVSDAQLAAMIQSAIDWYTEHRFAPALDNPPSGYSADCSQDEGSDAQLGDRGGAPFGVHDPSSLFANVSWTNKWNATCVKNQATRGTCATFATVSALEMLAKKTTGRSMNLSEQHVMATYKTRWAASEYNEGSDPFEIAAKMSATGYHVPFETSWHYNPSGLRKLSSTAPFFTHSCDSYSEACSDTAHQARLTCLRAIEGTFCKATTQDGPQVSTVTAPSEQSRLTLTDYEDRDRMLTQAIMTLYFGDHAVIASFDVGSAFVNAPSSGIVPDVVGGGGIAHAVHVVGYVANGDLPASIAPADGRGYFIVKNSWGTEFGDQGYYYVPYTWMKLYAVDFTAL